MLTSLVVIVKDAAPGAVGVPEIRPVCGFRLKPFGSAPLLTVKVYGASPPLAINVWLYGAPTAPFGRLVGAKLICRATIIWTVAVGADPAALLAVTVNVAVFVIDVDTVGLLV
jgi:hypothetical protein